MAEELSETALRALVARWVRAALEELIEEDSATGESEQYASLPSLCGTMETEVTPGEPVTRLKQSHMVVSSQRDGEIQREREHIQVVAFAAHERRSC